MLSVEIVVFLVDECRFVAASTASARQLSSNPLKVPTNAILRAICGIDRLLACFVRVFGVLLCTLDGLMVDSMCCTVFSFNHGLTIDSIALRGKTRLQRERTHAASRPITVRSRAAVGMWPLYPRPPPYQASTAANTHVHNQTQTHARYGTAQRTIRPRSTVSAQHTSASE